MGLRNSIVYKREIRLLLVTLRPRTLQHDLFVAATAIQEGFALRIQDIEGLDLTDEDRVISSGIARECLTFQNGKAIS